MKLALFLAALSWIASFAVNEAYTETTWQCLASLALVDVVFMYLFKSSRVNYIKARWVWSLLFISVVVTTVFMLLMFAYQSKIIGISFYPFGFFVNHYQTFGLTVSALIMLTCIIPTKIVSALDGLYWPNFANDIRYSCDMDSPQDNENGLR